MQQGIHRLLALVAVFTVAFGAVYVIRNGTAGISRLWDHRDGSGSYHQPEKATMSDRAPLELGEVELLARLDAEQTKLMKAVVPSVVSIDTAGVRSERLIDGWGQTRGIRRVPTQGQGSGVIVSEEGHILTNQHVISGQPQIRIRTYDGKEYGASIVGQDPQLDVAVLKLDAPAGEKFRPLKFGDSSQVLLGQKVFAIGNPFGFGESVTGGMISAVERSISDTQRDLFQTDAAINPGNSGGPLVNVQGEIIGINSAIYSPDRANPGFQGVGFSIPSNDVRDALLAILERGRPIRGYLGLRMVDTPSGVQVLALSPGGPAETAGIKAGDLVENYDGDKIHSIEQLITSVQRTRIGRKVSLIVNREGQQMKLEATITESQPEPEAPVADQSRTREPEEVLEAVGVRVRDFSETERRLGSSGVVVTGVSSTGLAANRLQAGDCIISVNHNDVRNRYEFYRNLAASAGVQPTTISYVREGKAARADLPAVPRKEE
ncbi:trypsin-like peptidase domain-containing protein [Haloferula sp. BvORR071]|uniref:trypsin-like peptidase domain-containing protein n=1 Tax=Haloferula sp. BvORR071 TaxID=1396141 RepID=UPI0006988E13|nr:trypsin-like peptidase domain-containing protein [Haloferula sp. BvORR071]